MARCQKIDTFYHILKHVGAALSLCLILLLGAKIRLQGMPNIPTGHFAANDAFLYYSQSETILTDGKLPKVDQRRWVPTGRDLGQTFSGYAYALAYAYSTIKLFLPNVTRYQVLLVMPTLCFLLGMMGLCIFLYIRFGFTTAAIAGILLTFMPGSIERSAAGFSDRDAWCLMLGTLAVTAYLWKENITRKWNRYIFTCLSGLFVCLGGVSWEGFGVFVLTIVVIEIWRFLTTDTEEHISEYLLWVLSFIPTLYLFSPPYQSGSGWTTHASAFLLVPPIVMLLLRTIRYFLTRAQHPFAKGLTEKMSTRGISLVLCAICILSGIAYIVFVWDTFAQSILPFSSEAVIGTVLELLSPTDIFWYGRYGHVLLVASTTLTCGCLIYWGKKAIPLAIAITVFTATTFLRQYLYHLISPVICEYLFYGAVAFTPIAAMGTATLRTQKDSEELTYIALAFWLMLWTGLARDAQRYDFFIGIPLACFAAVGIQNGTTQITKHLMKKIKTPINRKKHDTIHAWTKTAITIAVILMILLWEPPGNTHLPPLTHRGYQIKVTQQNVYPGKDTPMAKACRWIKQHRSADNVFAAPWSYGHMLNVLGGVKTIIDPDHFILRRIHQYQEHVITATTEREALEFLKTHNVTHILMSEQDVLHIASLHTDERAQYPIPIVKLIPHSHTGSIHARFIPANKKTMLNFVEINFYNKPPTATAKLKNGKTVKIGYVKPDGTAEKNSEKYGGILHHFDTKTHQEAIHYLSAHAWNSFAIKLFFRNQQSNAFVPVYPQQDTKNAKVKIWEIQYPPNIKENPKYLEG